MVSGPDDIPSNHDLKSRHDLAPTSIHLRVSSSNPTRISSDDEWTEAEIACAAKILEPEFTQLDRANFLAAVQLCALYFPPANGIDDLVRHTRAFLQNIGQS